jgi:hypothetical protein
MSSKALLSTDYEKIPAAGGDGDLVRYGGVVNLGLTRDTDLIVYSILFRRLANAIYTNITDVLYHNLGRFKTLCKTSLRMAQYYCVCCMCIYLD